MVLAHDYKCPVCQYTYKAEYGSFDEPAKPIEGDEEPVSIRVESHKMYGTTEKDDFDSVAVRLVGCPKCKSVTFEQIW